VPVGKLVTAALCGLIVLCLVWFLGLFLFGTAFLAFYTPGAKRGLLNNATLVVVSALALYAGLNVGRKVWKRLNKTKLSPNNPLDR
jgi:divalent metal cation (Fe/Co/Zn/Cd) transporter